MDWTAFRIINALSERDYREIARLLTLKGDPDEGGSEDEELECFYGEDDKRVALFEPSELELPLATIGGGARSGPNAQIVSADSKNYMVGVDVGYESRENNFPDAIKALGERCPQGYTINTGKKTADRPGATARTGFFASAA